MSGRLRHGLPLPPGSLRVDAIEHRGNPQLQRVVRFPWIAGWPQIIAGERKKVNAGVWKQRPCLTRLAAAPEERAADCISLLCPSCAPAAHLGVDAMVDVGKRGRDGHGR